MRTLLFAIITLISLSSAIGQSFYGLTFMKPYTQNEIKENFRENVVTIDGHNIDVSIGNNRIRLEFDCLDYQCDVNTLTRLCSFDLPESKASLWYDSCKNLFGTPTGGFEEERILKDDLFHGPSITEINKIFYFKNKYRDGDVLQVTMTISNSGYTSGKLNKLAFFDIDYSPDARYWQKPESKSRYNDGSMGEIFKGWNIKVLF
jgi:hypothetical protein